MPRLIFDARLSCDVAASVREEETSVPSPWAVEEPCFATMREAP